MDTVTVPILERAWKVDPEFKKMIGVLTKPDLVDQGGEHEVILHLLIERNLFSWVLHGKESFTTRTRS